MWALLLLTSVIEFILDRLYKLDLFAALPSDTVSQANTLELYRPPVYTDDSKSYSTYERRSLPDDDYRAYDPAIVVCVLPQFNFFTILFINSWRNVAEVISVLLSCLL